MQRLAARNRELLSSPFMYRPFLTCLCLKDRPAPIPDASGPLIKHHLYLHPVRTDPDLRIRRYATCT
jgi:hypothetical protein